MIDFAPVNIDHVFTPVECQKIIQTCESYGLKDGTTYFPGAEQEEQLMPSSRIAEEVRPPTNAKTEWFVDRCRKAVWQANEKFDFDLSETTPLEWMFAKYPVGGHFADHIDTIGVGAIRKLTGSIQLSDESTYGDGWLSIVTEPTPVKTQGSAAIFPSFILHKVAPVSWGVRYALIFWAHGDRPFR